MIGFGCDRTNANFAQGGLRGILTCEMLWVFVFLCLSYHLELSVKDALKLTFYATVEELLYNFTIYIRKVTQEVLRVERHCHQAKGMFGAHRDAQQRRNMPLRACGTRFAVHKVAAPE